MLKRLLFESRFGDRLLAMFEKLFGLALVDAASLAGERATDAITPIARGIAQH